MQGIVRLLAVAPSWACSRNSPGLSASTNGCHSRIVAQLAANIAYCLCDIYEAYRLWSI